MDISILKQNLETCLLNKANNWYIGLLHTAKLKLKDRIRLWCEALKSRFKESFKD